MPSGSEGGQPRPGGAEPVAVVGIGCRFPGDVESPSDFWELLVNGRDTIGEVPDERWQPYQQLGPEYQTALRRAVRSGSFLRAIDRFDAEFFGISPREAALMDPQQRILLEVTWQALEHAGIPPTALAGTETGVFIGVCTGDYGAQILEDLPSIEAWTGIGAATCAVANRISHVLDLRGASLAVDTACSASLVAIHLACQSLRLGESGVALAGGVNLIVSPGQSITLNAAGALAPDGRSKSFDASADGYGRGEGCGVVVLKRLADADRDGDPILAVIRGSAVNQDGHTNGIMAPCGSAQEQVMRRACDNAGIDPGTMDYVEAHGTGTRLGDPMEAAALSAVFGTGRAGDEPCLIGSVKSNIGHLEGAAGIASVIKAILALNHAEIPPSLLRTGPSPEIPWADSGLSLVTRQQPWPRREHPRRAGVSGFGYGGTVAHVVLDEAPERVPRASTGAATNRDGYRLFPLSAATEPALRQHADRLAGWLADQDADAPLTALGHTLAVRRSHLARRAVVAASDRTDLAAKLRELAGGRPAAGTATGGSGTGPGGGLVWVFSGHGSQWSGMGRELLAKPAFAQVIDVLEPIFQAEIGFSPRQVLIDRDIEGVDRIQTMIFAMQMGLAALWRSYGVTPAAVIGHSVGEIGAAVACGALTLQDGGRLICRRSRLLRRASGRGAMAMVTLPFEEVARRLADRTDLVAAISASPASTVVAGDPAAVDAMMAQWPAEGVGVRRVASDVAFHSPHMDPLLADLVSAVKDLAYAPHQVKMYATALADPRTVPATDAEYWAANLRNPVRLAAAVTAAWQDGYQNFLEISPHPVVAHSIGETLGELGGEDAFVGVTLRRDQPEELTFLTGLGALHSNGIAVDWSRLQPGGDLVDLPTNPWQGRRHWHQPVAATRSQGRGHEVDSHTLLGARGSVAGSALLVWRTSLSDENRPYPGSHTLNAVEIVPAAVLVETFRRAASSDGALPGLANVEMRHPLMTADRREIQVVLDGAMVRLASRTPAEDAEQDPPWLIHAQAEADGGTGVPLPDSLDDAAQHRLFPLDPGLIRERLVAVGVPTTGFDWTVEELLSGVDLLQARIRLPRPARGKLTWAPVLDAVMSVAPAGFAGHPLLRMVVRIDDVATIGEPPEVCQIRIVLDGDRADTVDALVADTTGRVVARLSGLRYPVIEHALGDDGAEPGSAGGSGLDAAALSQLPLQRQREQVLEEVRTQIAAEMRLSPDDLNPRRPLLEQGLDSVLTVAIRRRLEKRFGQRLQATVFWQQPTVSAIADHLVDLLSTH